MGVIPRGKTATRSLIFFLADIRAIKTLTAATYLVEMNLKSTGATTKDMVITELANEIERMRVQVFE